MSTIRHWYDEGMRRRFVIQKAGRAIVDLPLLVAIVGALLAPWLAVLAIVLAVVTNHTVRMEEPPAAEAPEGADAAPAPADTAESETPADSEGEPQPG